MNKPYDEFKTFSEKDIEHVIEHELIDIIRNIIEGKNNEEILDMIKKENNKFITLFADSYVSLYRLRHELANTQQMILDRNNEINKILDLCNQSISIALSKKDDEEH